VVSCGAARQACGTYKRQRRSWEDDLEVLLCDLTLRKSYLDVAFNILPLLLITIIINKYKPTELDIIIRDNEEGPCMLIDVAISGDRNVIKHEAEKILKYKDLTIEIQRMLNVKKKVIPVIIGATGTISKSFRKYASTIAGNHEVRELQKTGILGTAHIIRKLLT
jgi:hypothetical protein